MVSVSIPKSFIKEREYIVNIILGDYLGLDYKYTFTDLLNHYHLILPNGNKLIIEDHFFSTIQEQDGYLHTEYIPEKIRFCKTIFSKEETIPVVFGNASIEHISASKDSIIKCCIDIFASSFFMLTRWEEYVIRDRDEHGRFPASAAVSFKNGFLHRPVVNEYVEMLWNLLLKLGIQQKRKTLEYQILPTHDIDWIIYPYSLLSFINGIYLSRQPGTVIKHFRAKRNHYDSFDWLMESSEKRELVSRFYFTSNGTDKYDSKYEILNPKLLETISEINRRKHIIGFHPGYATFNDAQEWQKQKQIFERATGLNPVEGRQHFLRFELPLTWQIWEDNGMVLDSTLGYAEKEGYRCGTGNEFPVFNILTRKTLGLKERPLVLMDTTFQSKKYNKQPLDNIYGIFNYYKEISRRYNMPFTILFHNSSFAPIEWSGWKELYENILS